MIKVVKKEGESGERLLKRFSSHVKSRKLLQKFRELRYFKQKPRKGQVRIAAVIREEHRAEAKKQQFLS
jgi:ribosomal protein S21